eukprot:gnl/TRDRNA2_/TRDRNA2_173311_c0_seq10.p1 gnl/TRDRNA2_/TRDRNA2_173311_c0~~gnl/TRDRNA2_/TRDRNA2_173311_c0_seq10.p1  ORF type:complete len:459 (-),score=61.60 gnl/TRDRNA2_/TRDRNA2_173311_c0_seq10:247-1623(-)
MALCQLSVLILGLASWHANAEGEVVYGGHYNACRGISFKPDGSQVVLASEDNPANLRPDPPSVHNTATGETMFLLGGEGGVRGQHGGPVWDAVFDNVDGTLIATGAATSEIIIWSMGAHPAPPEDVGPHQSYIAVHTLAAHAGHVMAIDWHPSSKNRFVSCDSTGSFIVWNYDTNALSATYQTWVPSATAAPAPSELAADFAPLDAIPRILTDVKFAPNGDWIGLCGFHMFCNVFSPSNVVGQTWNTAWLMGPAALTHGASVWGIAFSANNQYIATGGYDHMANIFEDTNFGTAGGVTWTYKASLQIQILDPSWTRACPIGMAAGCTEEVCTCPEPPYIGGPVWSVGFYGTLPISADADHFIRMWTWENDKYVPKYSFKGCLSPAWDIAIHTQTTPMIGVACGADGTGRAWPIPAESAFTTTTTTLPWVMFQGAGERAAPGLIALLALLVSGIAQRGA